MSTDIKQAPLSSRVRSLLSKANIPAASLTPEQRIRAIAADTEKQGLAGQALVTWILEAKNGSQQIADAKAQREAEEREARKAERASRPRTERKPREPKDPDARHLVERVQEFTGMDWMVPVGSGREYLDHYSAQRFGDTVHVRRDHGQGVEGAIEEATLNIAALTAFAKDQSLDEEVKKEIRAKLVALKKGTCLGGKPFAAKILLTASGQ